MLEELSLHILDIGMNSIAAGAKTIQITVREDRQHDRLVLRIRDDGCGMDASTREAVLARGVTTKTARKKNVGLGLALLRQTAEMCGGQFHLRSAPGKGTTVTASMQQSHVDCPPVGDLNATLLALCAASPETDVRLDYRMGRETFRFSSKEGTTS